MSTIDHVLDADGRVCAEWPCRSCGYDLQQLTSASDCPECGTAIAESLRDDSLRFADPAWLRCVGSGARLMVIGILLSVVLSVGFSISSPVWNIPWAYVLLNTLAAGVAVAVFLVGVWRFTRVDPLSRFASLHDRRRKWARITNTAANALTVVPMWFMFDSMWPGVATSFITALLQAAGVFTGLLYAMHLASRLPDDRLRRSTRIVMWGCGSAFVLLAFLNLAHSVLMAMWSRLVTVSPSPSSVSTTIEILMNVLRFALLGVFVLLLAAGIWWMVLMFKYRRRLREVADQSEGLQAPRSEPQDHEPAAATPA